MKTLSIVSLFLSISLFSSMAHAGLETITCTSMQGSNHELTLIIANNDLKQIRISSAIGGSFPRAFIPQKLANQNIQGLTLYTIAGMEGLMEVDNAILEGNSGIVRLSEENFSCF